MSKIIPPISILIISVASYYLIVDETKLVLDYLAKKEIKHESISKTKFR